MDQQTCKLVMDIFNSIYGFIAVDKEGIITLIGRDYAATLGYTQEECIGRPVTEIIGNTRLPIVLQRRKEEWGRYMFGKNTDGVSIGGIPTVCNRMLIYSGGERKPDKVVGAMAFGVYVASQDAEKFITGVETLKKRSFEEAPNPKDCNLDEILGCSPMVQSMKDLIFRVANTMISVCILGETGTGKELVANAIHKLSDRAEKPFVKINCAAIPKDLIESELFGYEPGAFTGASRQGKRGKFELANGGTLLLDEIGELPLNLQAKLLRVIEAREVERVGGAKPIPLDIRFICSTNQNLKQMVQDGQFRADLYYRINTMEIHVPPLRERRGDIPELAAYFIENANIQNGLAVTRLHPQALQMLNSYDWPGNIRELEHSIERACVLCGEGELMPDHFCFLTNGVPAEKVPQGSAQNANLYRMRLDGAERNAIMEAMAACHGNKFAAARMLNISRPTLYSKLKKYNIE